MSAYVLVESRDVNTTPAVTGIVNMAAQLQKDGYQVTLFLRQKSVPADKHSLFAQRLSDVAKTGVAVFADEQSLSDRGISLSSIPRNINAVSLQTMLDHVTDDDIVIWH